MKLEIISPEKVLHSGEVELVTVPGMLGSFTILNNHAPIVSVLTKGTIRYGTQSNQNILDIESGFVEASDNNVTICVE